MAVSAAFTVNGNANPAAHSVTYGSTVNLQLTNYAGVDSIEWTCEAVSESGVSAPAITASGTPAGRTASFTFPSSPGAGLGLSVMIKCRVRSGRTTATEHAIIGVANDNGHIPVCPGEANYRDSTHGWIGTMNAALRAAAYVPVFDVTRDPYNAVADGVTDDTAAIQAAITAINSAGKGILYLPGRRFKIKGSITPPTVPATIRGAGIGETVLDWDNTAHLWNTGSQARHSQQYLSFEDFSVEGKWDTLAHSSFFMPFSIYGVDDVSIRRVELRNCTYFGFVLRGCERVLVTECRLYEIGRDAISCATCTHVTVTDNQIDHIDDDAITVHIQSDSAESILQGFVISNNRISDAQGIVARGGRRGSITGNVIERCRARGVKVFSESEMRTVTFGLTIANNIITDIFNRNTIDGISNAADYIHVASTPQAGDGDAVPGLPDTSTGTFEPLDANLDNNDQTSPVAPAHWLCITGNVLARTLPTGVAYSTYGWGEMFTRSGYVDPTITDAMLANANGVQVLDGLRDSLIAGNIIRGMGHAIQFAGTTADLENIGIRGNLLVRFIRGIVFGGSISGGKSIDISNNTFDGDPYHEHSNRGANGTWLANGAPDGILVQGATGLTVRGNTFRRMCRISDVLLSAGSDKALFEGNIWECNPAAAGFSTSNEGIGNIPRGGAKGTHLIVDDDPESATFGQTLNVCQVDSNAIPSAGTYVAGHFVRSNTFTLDGNNMLILGWGRLTTGSNHVAGTDWVICHASHVSPAD